MSQVLTNVCVTNNNPVRLYSVRRGEKKFKARKWRAVQMQNILTPSIGKNGQLSFRLPKRRN
jgi:hypothetical protein